MNPGSALAAILESVANQVLQYLGEPALIGGNHRKRVPSDGGAGLFHASSQIFEYGRQNNPGIDPRGRSLRVLGRGRVRQQVLNEILHAGRTLENGIEKCGAVTLKPIPVIAFD